MLVTKNTTANATPDPGQGGTAVTGPTNTGHGSTTAQGNNNTQTKTCIWTGMQAAPSGLIISQTLKVDYTENGRVDDVAHSSNEFILGHSENGGGSWTDFFDHVNVTSASGAQTASFALSRTQDLTQVRVRDFLFGESDTLGIIGNVVVTISNIRVEVVLTDGVLVIMM